MSVKVKKYARVIRKAPPIINGFVSRSRRTPGYTLPKLPDEHNPVIVRVMTRSELASIPRDRYKVKVIRVMAPLSETGEFEGEEELLVAITNSTLLTKHLKNFRQTLRASLRKNRGGGGDSPSSNPFKEPIDQHQMADCIIHVMDSFFHGEDQCTICDKDYSMMDFCVLMHIFFKKINFLKKEARLPFSGFVHDGVCPDKPRLSFIKSYNNCSNKNTYIDFEKQLDIKQFNFKSHPIPPEKKPSDYHQRIILEMSMAFQEIGRAFQKSPYFIKLKELKKNVNEFVLQ